MRINFFIMLMASALFLVSCASSDKKALPPVTTATSGPIKNRNLPYPIYLVSKIENRAEVITKSSPDVFIIHTGHILKPELTKEQNEAALESLKDKGIDLVNLTLEDFTIAANQEIAFEKYPQKFLNSSVVDLNEDTVIIKPNIASFVVKNGIAFIGLSDKNLDKTLVSTKFLVSDYALAVLRARKFALTDKKSGTAPTSFIIIHTMGSDINEVMDRLPPNFINSLAD
jgi:hypothetical protein